MACQFFFFFGPLLKKFAHHWSKMGTGLHQYYNKFKTVKCLCCQS